MLQTPGGCLRSAMLRLACAITVLLAATAYAASEAAAWGACSDRGADRKPDPMQVRLQDMLDSIEDEEELISRLRSEGEIGRVLAVYYANRENLLDEDFLSSESSRSLENVLSFSIMKILKLDGATQGTKFFRLETNIRLGNIRTCAYPRDNFFINFIPLKGNKIKDSLNIRAGNSISNLRYTAPFRKDDHLLWYGNALRRSSIATLRTELSYWEKFFREEICGQKYQKGICIDKLVEKIAGHSFRSLEDLFIDLFCNVKIVDGDRLYEFAVCYGEEILF